MAADFLATVKEINNLVNFYDPPKDLHDAPGLTNKLHADEIKDAMEGLFRKSVPVPWVAVGKKIGARKTLDIIKEAIEANAVLKKVIDERQLIIRINHTSGHSPKPDGLCLAQDCGPVDIVSNARLIITPGSIIDPAGKTKEVSRNGLYTVSNIVRATNNLPKSFLDAIDMGFIESVKLDKEANGDYKITIVINGVGTITEIFDSKTFSPSGGGDDPSFFAGNPKKNKKIAALIKEYQDDPSKKKKNLIKIQHYLLCKELGDTLQIIWLKHIFALGNIKTDDDIIILKTNTVMGTTDEGVLYRCIINSVGVIHTIDHGGITHMYMPKDLTGDDLVKLVQQQIEQIQKDVIGQNITVIDNLQAIINSPRGDDSWIETAKWGNKQSSVSLTYREYAKNLLEKLVTALNLYNDNLNRRFDGLIASIVLRNTEAENNTIIQTAKEMAKDERFREPFIDCRNSYYKIKSITAIVYNRKIKFDPKRFTETSIKNYSETWTSELAGGGKYMIGGDIKDSIIRKSRQQLKYLTTDAERDQYKMPESMNTILTANVPLGLGVPTLDRYFLFYFIREFIPELCAYAQFMKAGLLEARIQIDSTHNNYIDIFNDTKIEYRWLENNQIQVGAYTETELSKDVFELQIEVFPAARGEEYFTVAKEIIKYSDLFIKLFPSFNTKIITDFFNYIHTNVLSHVRGSFYDISNATLRNIEAHVNLSGLEGGGITEEQLDKAASIAIDSYDLYYESLIKSAYYHPKIESTSVVSTTHVESPGSKTQRATKAKANTLVSKTQVKSPGSKTQRITKTKANTLITPKTRAYVRNSSGTPQRKSVRKVLFVDQEPISVGGKRRTRRKGKKGSKTRRRA